MAIRYSSIRAEDRSLALKSDQPCICWAGPVIGHSKHCCFRDMPKNHPPLTPLPCGHFEEGMRRYMAYSHSLAQEGSR